MEVLKKGRRGKLEKPVLEETKADYDVKCRQELEKVKAGKGS